MTENHPDRLSSQSPRSNIPVPDPSLLTTQQLLRELSLLREELSREIGHVRDAAASRMDAMDEASALRLNTLQEVRPQTERLLNHLRELVDEKFASVYRMFDERDERTKQASEASRQALDAALAAAKELVSTQAAASAQAAEKAELATAKQIDQIGLRIDGQKMADDARYQELKERIDRGEGQSQGGVARVTDQRATVAAVIGVSTFVLAIVVVVANFLSTRGG